MCGRFAFYSPSEAAAALFGVSASIEVQPRYNIAPTQRVLTIRPREDGRAADIRVRARQFLFHLDVRHRHASPERQMSEHCDVVGTALQDVVLGLSRNRARCDRGSKKEGVKVFHRAGQFGRRSPKRTDKGV